MSVNIQASAVLAARCSHRFSRPVQAHGSPHEACRGKEGVG